MIAFVVVCIIVAIFVASWFRQADKTQRQGAMSQLAQEMGLEFFEEDPFDLEAQVNFSLFKKDTLSWGKYGISNVLPGMLGDTQVFLFDYTYRESSGDSYRVSRQTVFLALDKTWSLPDFCLRRKPGWQKAMGTIGFPSGIALKEDPDFSQTFLLTGEDKAQIQKLFGPSVQMFVARYGELRLEVSGPSLIAYQPDVRLSVAYDAQAFYEDCCELIELLKSKDK